GGFLVKTDEGLVRVLGTNFNVYARKDGFAVDCYIGKVEARKDGKVVEVPNGTAVEWKDDQFLNKSNFYLQPKWLDTSPESIYENVPLSKVVREIERQFGLQIEIDIEEDYLYRGGFPHDDLQQAMDNITEVWGLKYEQDGTRIRIWEE
ncbi:MAG: FecR domain-containing protein, partial [Bacteroidota bacterium]